MLSDAAEGVVKVYHGDVLKFNWEEACSGHVTSRGWEEGVVLKLLMSICVTLTMHAVYRVLNMNTACMCMLCCNCSKSLFLSRKFSFHSILCKYRDLFLPDSSFESGRKRSRYINIALLNYLVTCFE